ncbi:MAG: ATP-binding protein [Pseudomonadota bacterium]
MEHKKEVEAVDDIQHDLPTVIQSELAVYAYKFILKVDTWVICPLMTALMGYFWLNASTLSAAIVSWILFLALLAVAIDRTPIAQSRKMMIGNTLFTVQVLSAGLFLLYGICAIGDWELIPWVFPFCYVAVIIIGVKHGAVISGVFAAAVASAYFISSPPEFLSTGALMPRFFLSLLLSSVFISSAEIARNVYRRRLVQANVGLATSEEKYRRLYHQLTKEIRERKKAEFHLQQSQKMDSIGNLAGGIAHDFNNILFPITGMAELLTLELPPGSPEHESAREILLAGKRGTELVDQILAFSRKTKREKAPVNLLQILGQVSRLVRFTIPADIEIEQDIDSECGRVHGDASQLHQVIMNIVTNAYHAVERDGGKITIHLQETVFTDQDSAASHLAPGPYARLTICDTGMGINPVVMDKIFEPYFTTKETGKGTGLGLAVAYGIIAEHGGDIEVFSEPGRGSTFDIYLPIMETPASTDIVAEKITRPSENERVLLVDDDELVLRTQQRMLVHLGYQVTAMSSSIDALEAFKTAPDAWDFVVTDVAMPRMTGDRLAAELISIRSDIPIILCTGFSERISQEKAAAIGIRGYLMKPVKIQNLATAVRSVLDGTDGKPEAGPGALGKNAFRALQGHFPLLDRTL